MVAPTITPTLVAVVHEHKWLEAYNTTRQSIMRRLIEVHTADDVQVDDAALRPSRVTGGTRVLP